MELFLNDEDIVSLYWERNEQALEESSKKYHHLLCNLISSFLESREDAEECENDTYLGAWNHIPTDRPNYLGAYLSKIARCLAISRFRKNHAAKRGKTDELSEELLLCIPESGDSPQEILEGKELRSFMNWFIRNLKEEERYLFLRRYFYGDSLEQLHQKTGFSEGKIKSMLFRLRKKLKEQLTKEALL